MNSVPSKVPEPTSVNASPLLMTTVSCIVSNAMTESDRSAEKPNSLRHQSKSRSKICSTPGKKRTHDLIFLNYWLPGMRKSIADFVLKCDPCQRRKEDLEYTSPLGEVEQPTAPFEITSMDETEPYLLTPRKNNTC